MGLSPRGARAGTGRLRLDYGSATSHPVCESVGSAPKRSPAPGPIAAVLGATETLSAGGHDAVGPQLASDQGGDAIVVWQRSDGTNFRIQGATGP